MKTLLQRANWLFWLLFVIALPITSFPLVARFVHSSSVAPASLIFAGLLIVFWLPGFIKKRGAFPVQSRFLIYFALFAILATLLAYFQDIPLYKQNSVLAAALEGLLTLAIGIVFFFLTASIPTDEDKLRRTMQMINIGGGLVVFWSILQLLFAYTMNGGHPHWFGVTQRFFSLTVFNGFRAYGLASEPSWMAHLLNMVYLPYWLAATIHSYSSFKVRLLRKITIENILLVLGIFVLVGTLSRGGLAAFILVVAYLFLRLNIKVIRSIQAKWKNSASRVVFSLLLITGFVAFYLGIVIGGVFALSKIDPRMKDVFDFSTGSSNPLVNYADNLKFGERVAYWNTGWNIYNDHPVLGVGVGMAGFYFPEELPDYSYQMTETRRLYYRSAGLMNIKSLWSRILAETGIVGFSLFLFFLITILFTARAISRSNKKILAIIGWMGIYMLIAFIMEGFSLDTFALPYYWFTLGLVCAASTLQGDREVSSQNHG